MKKPALLFLILILQAYTLRAQSPEFREYLFQAIQTSPSAKHIDLLRLRSKHQYSYRLSELKTSIRLTGDLPGISRSITSVWQPDGGQRFLQQNRAYSSLGLS
ncbi:MAG: hypothetical protein JJ975_08735, partial [Bacteroidia bacterium]|nr:hypothetical protein [Bacteroidia bacterium]